MQSSQPLVSVVIPCYNHEQFVQDSIQSVIDQTYEYIELIIIDDGSKDDSALKIQEMIESCKKRFVKFEFRSRANLGLSATLNEALEWCEGEYFSPLASDDQMLENKTAIQVDFLNRNSNCTAVFGGFHIIDDKSQFIDTKLGLKKIYDFKKIYLHRHDLPAPTAMMRLNTVKALNNYDPEIKIEDWYMWLKLSMVGNLIYLPIVMSNYRHHEDNTSKKSSLMKEERLKIINLYSEAKYFSIAEKNLEWIDMIENNQLRGKKRFLIKNIDYLFHKILWKFL